MKVSESDPIAPIRRRSRSEADRGLWHAIPVWFVGENAVVGYDERKANRKAKRKSVARKAQ
jgi:hypothetical protein